MAQEGRGNKTSVPSSFFEIDDFDTDWDAEAPSGFERAREPSVPPEPGSEVQATSSRPRADASAEEPASGPFHGALTEAGFDEGLPLVHPDLDTAPANLGAAQKKTVPAREGPREAVRRTGPAFTGHSAADRPAHEDRITPLGLDLDVVSAFAEVSDGAEDEHSRPTSPGDPLIGEARDRYATGDYSGALVVAEGILATDPENVQARRYADNCRQVLEQMFTAKLGPLDQRPRVALTGDRLRWLSLDHRAGFLLSLIDGSSTVEELLDISGMPRFEALRTLCELLEQNVIALTRG